MSRENNEDVSFGLLKHISPDKIDIDVGKTRTLGSKAGLENLKNNIENIGLLHPIVVFPKDDRYELIAGSRRLAAVKELGWETIPATVLRPMDTITAKIASVSENVHRNALPFRDMVAVCDYLYDELNGDVNAIARKLSVAQATVQRYISLRLTPEPIKKMIEAKQISRQDGVKLVAATWPNEEKMEKLANRMVEMTREEKSRVVDTAIENPDYSADQIVEDSKKPQLQLIIHLPTKYAEALDKAAGDMELDREDLAKTVLIDWLVERYVRD